MLRLRIDSDAQAELDAAMAWYELQRAGLGLEFLAAAEQCMEQVRASPMLWGAPPGVSAGGQVRRALVTGFPYAVVYQLRGDGILVLAVAHGHQRPGYWRSRMP